MSFKSKLILSLLGVSSAGLAQETDKTQTNIEPQVSEAESNLKLRRHENIDAHLDSAFIKIEERAQKFIEEIKGFEWEAKTMMRRRPQTLGKTRFTFQK